MNYSSLKTETEFIKKLVADIISRFGDSLDVIAFSWMVYALTKSASLTALTFGVNTFVSVFLSPFAASLITNWNKKTIIVACDIFRGLLVILTAALFYYGKLQPWMIMVITGLNSTFEAFRNPAGTSIFPFIVSKEKYSLAVSLSSSLSKVAEIIGMGIAGVVIGLFGVPFALLIDALTFFISAFILITLKLPKHVKKLVPSILKEFTTNTKEGFVYVLKNEVILAVCIVAGFLNFALTPITALQAAYVSESLKLSAEALSVIGISISIGMALGSIVVPKLLTKWSRFAVLLIGIIGVSLGFTALFFIPLFPIIYKWISLGLLFFIMGISVALASTVAQIVFVEKVEQQYLARASGIMSSICMIAMPLASIMLAVLLQYLSVTYVILIFGIISMIVATASWFVEPLRRL